MQVATQLIFHDVARSEWIETYVTERLFKLDRLAGGIMSCRLTLTREQSSHHQGNLYSVLVEVRLPPHHALAAKKQKNIGDIATELPALITEGFAAIESQLRKTVERRRTSVRIERKRKLNVVAPPRKRAAVRRGAVKTTAVEKTRAEGGARNVDRVLDSPSAPFERTPEQIARKPAPKAKVPLAV